MAGEGYLAEIRSFVSDAFGAGGSPLGDDQPLLGEVLDSIGVLTLATHLEDTYGISIGAHEMDPANFGTLRSLAAFVARKTGKG